MSGSGSGAGGGARLTPGSAIDRYGGSELSGFPTPEMPAPPARRAGPGGKDTMFVGLHGGFGAPSPAAATRGGATIHLEEQADVGGMARRKEIDLKRFEFEEETLNRDEDYVIALPSLWRFNAAHLTAVYRCQNQAGTPKTWVVNVLQGFVAEIDGWLNMEEYLKIERRLARVAIRESDMSFKDEGVEDVDTESEAAPGDVAANTDGAGEEGGLDGGDDGKEEEEGKTGGTITRMFLGKARGGPRYPFRRAARDVVIEGADADDDDDPDLKLTFYSTTDAQRFYELAILVCGARPVWAPLLTKPPPYPELPTIRLAGAFEDAPLLIGPTRRPLLANPVVSKVRASREPFVSIDVWVGSLDLNYTVLPTRADLSRWIPKGLNVYVIGFVGLDPELYATPQKLINQVWREVGKRDYQPRLVEHGADGKLETCAIVLVRNAFAGRVTGVRSAVATVDRFSLPEDMTYAPPRRPTEEPPPSDEGEEGEEEGEEGAGGHDEAASLRDEMAVAERAEEAAEAGGVAGVDAGRESPQPRLQRQTESTGVAVALNIDGTRCGFLFTKLYVLRSDFGQDAVRVRSETLTRLMRMLAGGEVTSAATTDRDESDRGRERRRSQLSRKSSTHTAGTGATGGEDDDDDATATPVPAPFCEEVLDLPSYFDHTFVAGCLGDEILTAVERCHVLEGFEEGDLVLPRGGSLSNRILSKSLCGPWDPLAPTRYEAHVPWGTVEEGRHAVAAVYPIPTEVVFAEGLATPSAAHFLDVMNCTLYDRPPAAALACEDAQTAVGEAVAARSRGPSLLVHAPRERDPSAGRESNASTIRGRARSRTGLRNLRLQRALSTTSQGVRGDGAATPPMPATPGGGAGLALTAGNIAELAGAPAPPFATRPKGVSLAPTAASTTPVHAARVRVRAEFTASECIVEDGLADIRSGVDNQSFVMGGGPTTLPFEIPPIRPHTHSQSYLRNQHIRFTVEGVGSAVISVDEIFSAMYSLPDDGFSVSIERALSANREVSLRSMAALAPPQFLDAGGGRSTRSLSVRSDFGILTQSFAGGGPAGASGSSIGSDFQLSIAVPPPPTGASADAPAAPAATFVETPTTPRRRLPFTTSVITSPPDYADEVTNTAVLESFRDPFAPQNDAASPPIAANAAQDYLKPSPPIPFYLPLLRGGRYVRTSELEATPQGLQSKQETMGAVKHLGSSVKEFAAGSPSPRAPKRDALARPPRRRQRTVAQGDDDDGGEDDGGSNNARAPATATAPADESEEDLRARWADVVGIEVVFRVVVDMRPLFAMEEERIMRDERDRLALYDAHFQGREAIAAEEAGAAGHYHRVHDLVDLERGVRARSLALHDVARGGLCGAFTIVNDEAAARGALAEELQFFLALNHILRRVFLSLQDEIAAAREGVEAAEQRGMHVLVADFTAVRDRLIREHAERAALEAAEAGARATDLRNHEAFEWWCTTSRMWLPLTENAARMELEAVCAAAGDGMLQHHERALAQFHRRRDELTRQRAALVTTEAHARAAIVATACEVVLWEPGMRLRIMKDEAAAALALRRFGFALMEHTARAGVVRREKFEIAALAGARRVWITEAMAWDDVLEANAFLVNDVFESQLTVVDADAEPTARRGVVHAEALARVALDVTRDEGAARAAIAQQWRTEFTLGITRDFSRGEAEADEWRRVRLDRARTQLRHVEEYERECRSAVADEAEHAVRGYLRQEWAASVEAARKKTARRVASVAEQIEAGEDFERECLMQAEDGAFGILAQKIHVQRRERYARELLEIDECEALQLPVLAYERATRGACETAILKFLRDVRAWVRGAIYIQREVDATKDDFFDHDLVECHARTVVVMQEAAAWGRLCKAWRGWAARCTTFLSQAAGVERREVHARGVLAQVEAAERSTIETQHALPEQPLSNPFANDRLLTQGVLQQRVAVTRTVEPAAYSSPHGSPSGSPRAGSPRADASPRGSGTARGHGYGYGDGRTASAGPGVPGDEGRDSVGTPAHDSHTRSVVASDEPLVMSTASYVDRYVVLRSRTLSIYEEKLRVDLSFGCMAAAVPVHDTAFTVSLPGRFSGHDSLVFSAPTQAERGRWMAFLMNGVASYDHQGTQTGEVWEMELGIEAGSPLRGDALSAPAGGAGLDWRTHPRTATTDVAERLLTRRRAREVRAAAEARRQQQQQAPHRDTSASPSPRVRRHLFARRGGGEYDYDYSAEGCGTIDVISDDDEIEVEVGVCSQHLSQRRSERSAGRRSVSTALGVGSPRGASSRRGGSTQPYGQYAHAPFEELARLREVEAAVKIAVLHDDMPNSIRELLKCHTANGASVGGTPVPSKKATRAQQTHAAGDDLLDLEELLLHAAVAHEDIRMLVEDVARGGYLRGLVKMVDEAVARRGVGGRGAGFHPQQLPPAHPLPRRGEAVASVGRRVPVRAGVDLLSRGQQTTVDAEEFDNLETLADYAMTLDAKVSRSLEACKGEMSYNAYCILTENLNTHPVPPAQSPRVIPPGGADAATAHRTLAEVRTALDHLQQEMSARAYTTLRDAAAAAAWNGNGGTGGGWASPTYVDVTGSPAMSPVSRRAGSTSAVVDAATHNLEAQVRLLSQSVQAARDEQYLAANRTAELGDAVLRVVGRLYREAHGVGTADVLAEHVVRTVSAFTGKGHAGGGRGEHELDHAAPDSPISPHRRGHYDPHEEARHRAAGRLFTSVDLRDGSRSPSPRQAARAPPAYSRSPQRGGRVGGRQSPSAPRTTCIPGRRAKSYDSPDPALPPPFVVVGAAGQKEREVSWGPVRVSEKPVDPTVFTEDEGFQTDLSGPVRPARSAASDAGSSSSSNSNDGRDVEDKHNNDMLQLAALYDAQLEVSEKRIKELEAELERCQKAAENAAAAVAATRAPAPAPTTPRRGAAAHAPTHTPGGTPVTDALAERIEELEARNADLLQETRDLTGKIDKLEASAVVSKELDTLERSQERERSRDMELKKVLALKELTGKLDRLEDGARDAALLHLEELRIEEELTRQLQRRTLSSGDLKATAATPPRAGSRGRVAAGGAGGGDTTDATSNDDGSGQDENDDASELLSEDSLFIHIAPKGGRRKKGSTTMRGGSTGREGTAAAAAAKVEATTDDDAVAGATRPRGNTSHDDVLNVCGGEPPGAKITVAAEWARDDGFTGLRSQLDDALARLESVQGEFDAYRKVSVEVSEFNSVKAAAEEYKAKSRVDEEKAEALAPQLADAAKQYGMLEADFAAYRASAEAYRKTSVAEADYTALQAKNESLAAIAEDLAARVRKSVAAAASLPADRVSTGTATATDAPAEPSRRQTATQTRADRAQAASPGRRAAVPPAAASDDADALGLETVAAPDSWTPPAETLGAGGAPAAPPAMSLAKTTPPAEVGEAPPTGKAPRGAGGRGGKGAGSGVSQDEYNGLQKMNEELIAVADGLAARVDKLEAALGKKKTELSLLKKEKKEREELRKRQAVAQEERRQRGLPLGSPASQVTASPAGSPQRAAHLALSPATALDPNREKDLIDSHRAKERDFKKRIKTLQAENQELIALSTEVLAKNDTLDASTAALKKDAARRAALVRQLVTRIAALQLQWEAGVLLPGGVVAAAVARAAKEKDKEKEKAAPQTLADIDASVAERKALLREAVLADADDAVRAAVRSPRGGGGGGQRQQLTVIPPAPPSPPMIPSPVGTPKTPLHAEDAAPAPPGIDLHVVLEVLDTLEGAGRQEILDADRIYRTLLGTSHAGIVRRVDAGAVLQKRVEEMTLRAEERAREVEILQELKRQSERLQQRRMSQSRGHGLAKGDDNNNNNNSPTFLSSRPGTPQSLLSAAGDAAAAVVAAGELPKPAVVPPGSVVTAVNLTHVPALNGAPGVVTGEMSGRVLVTFGGAHGDYALKAANVALWHAEIPTDVKLRELALRYTYKAFDHALRLSYDVAHRLCRALDRVGPAGGVYLNAEVEVFAAVAGVLQTCAAKLAAAEGAALAKGTEAVLPPTTAASGGAGNATGGGGGGGAATERATPEVPAAPLPALGARVEAHGLTTARGKFMNGARGTVLAHEDARAVVEFPPPFGKAHVEAGHLKVVAAALAPPTGSHSPPAAAVGVGASTATATPGGRTTPVDATDVADLPPIGALLEAHGLTNERFLALNGQRGRVVKHRPQVDGTILPMVDFAAPFGKMMLRAKNYTVVAEGGGEGKAQEGARQPAAAPPPLPPIGAVVEAHSLTSANGLKLNGARGAVVQHRESNGTTLPIVEFPAPHGKMMLKLPNVRVVEGSDVGDRGEAAHAKVSEGQTPLPTATSTPTSVPPAPVATTAPIAAPAATPPNAPGAPAAPQPQPPLVPPPVGATVEAHSLTNDRYLALNGMRGTVLKHQAQQDGSNLPIIEFPKPHGKMLLKLKNVKVVDAGSGVLDSPPAASPPASPQAVSLPAVGTLVEAMGLTSEQGQKLNGVRAKVVAHQNDREGATLPVCEFPAPFGKMMLKLKNVKVVTAASAGASGAIESPAAASPPASPMPVSLPAVGTLVEAMGLTSEQGQKLNGVQAKVVAHQNDREGATLPMCEFPAPFGKMTLKLKNVKVVDAPTEPGPVLPPVGATVEAHSLTNDRYLALNGVRGTVLKHQAQQDGSNLPIIEFPAPFGKMLLKLKNVRMVNGGNIARGSSPVASPPASPQAVSLPAVGTLIEAMGLTSEQGQKLNGVRAKVVAHQKDKDSETLPVCEFPAPFGKMMLKLKNVKVVGAGAGAASPPAPTGTSGAVESPVASPPASPPPSSPPPSVLPPVGATVEAHGLTNDRYLALNGVRGTVLKHQTQQDGVTLPIIEFPAPFGKMLLKLKNLKVVDEGAASGEHDSPPAASPPASPMPVSLPAVGTLIEAMGLTSEQGQKLNGVRAKVVAHQKDKEGATLPVCEFPAPFGKMLLKLKNVKVVETGAVSPRAEAKASSQSPAGSPQSPMSPSGAASVEPPAVGATVEAHSLTNERFTSLNGKRGRVVKHKPQPDGSLLPQIEFPAPHGKILLRPKNFYVVGADGVVVRPAAAASPDVASPPASPQPSPLPPIGASIEAIALTSKDGQKLNGTRGVVVQHKADSSGTLLPVIEFPKPFGKMMLKLKNVKIITSAAAAAAADGKGSVESPVASPPASPQPTSLPAVGTLVEAMGLTSEQGQKLNGVQAKVVAHQKDKEGTLLPVCEFPKPHGKMMLKLKNVRIAPTVAAGASGAVESPVASPPASPTPASGPPPVGATVEAHSLTNDRYLALNGVRGTVLKHQAQQDGSNLPIIEFPKPHGKMLLKLKNVKVVSEASASASGAMESPVASPPVSPMPVSLPAVGTLIEAMGLTSEQGQKLNGVRAKVVAHQKDKEGVTLPVCEFPAPFGKMMLKLKNVKVVDAVAARVPGTAPEPVPPPALPPAPSTPTPELPSVGATVEAHSLTNDRYLALNGVRGTVLKHQAQQDGSNLPIIEFPAPFGKMLLKLKNLKVVDDVSAGASGTIDSPAAASPPASPMPVSLPAVGTLIEAMGLTSEQGQKLNGVRAKVVAHQKDKEGVTLPVCEFPAPFGKMMLKLKNVKVVGAKGDTAVAAPTSWAPSTTPTASVGPLPPVGARVEAHGLTSARGKFMNGSRGAVVAHEGGQVVVDLPQPFGKTPMDAVNVKLLSAAASASTASMPAPAAPAPSSASTATSTPPPLPPVGATVEVHGLATEKYLPLNGKHVKVLKHQTQADGTTLPVVECPPPFGKMLLKLKNVKVMGSNAGASGAVESPVASPPASPTPASGPPPVGATVEAHSLTNDRYLALNGVRGTVLKHQAQQDGTTLPVCEFPAPFGKMMLKLKNLKVVDDRTASSAVESPVASPPASPTPVSLPAVGTLIEAMGLTSEQGQKLNGVRAKVIAHQKDKEGTLLPVCEFPAPFGKMLLKLKNVKVVGTAVPSPAPGSPLSAGSPPGPPTGAATTLPPVGTVVEAMGLTSEQGQKLNGVQAKVVAHQKDKEGATLPVCEFPKPHGKMMLKLKNVRVVRLEAASMSPASSPGAMQPPASPQMVPPPPPPAGVGTVSPSPSASISPTPTSPQKQAKSRGGGLRGLFGGKRSAGKGSAPPQSESPEARAASSESPPPPPPPPADEMACPACTFLNKPAARSCEICMTPLP